MLTAFVALALQAAAPAPAPVCTAAVAPPAGLEAWSKPIGSSGVIGFVIGTAQDVSLVQTDAAKFPLAPSRTPAPGTFGNAVDFAITKAGTYRVALSAGAWIDVVRDGQSLKSVAHAEGTACSGIRKIVDFALVPGHYTLELSGAKTSAVRVLIVVK